MTWEFRPCLPETECRTCGDTELPKALLIEGPPDDRSEVAPLCCLCLAIALEQAGGWSVVPMVQQWLAMRAVGIHVKAAKRQHRAARLAAQNAPRGE